jgi:acyl-CoA synthetase (AMP-forming)/AMP-acid ligase II
MKKDEKGMLWMHTGDVGVMDDSEGYMFEVSTILPRLS